MCSPLDAKFKRASSNGKRRGTRLALPSHAAPSDKSPAPPVAHESCVSRFRTSEGSGADSARVEADRSSPPLATHNGRKSQPRATSRLSCTLAFASTCTPSVVSAQVSFLLASAGAFRLRFWAGKLPFARASRWR
eukprot:6178856-Pleurochrysis_carterae.AAC.2